MSEVPEWPTVDGLNFASSILISIWAILEFFVFVCWFWKYYERKAILVGIEVCEVFAILLSWISMGPEAFVSYLLLFGGVLSTLFALVGLVLTFLRDFGDASQDSSFHSLMVWTTFFEYIPLFGISILINNWTLMCYNCVMMILNPVSISEVINAIQFAFRDGIFDKSVDGWDIEANTPIEFLPEVDSEELGSDHDEEPDFTCGPLDCYWVHIATAAFSLIALGSFIAAGVVGGVNGVDIHWNCTDHLSEETCNQHKGLDDKWNSYTSLIACGFMMIPTSCALCFYRCSRKRDSTNPLYSLAVIQCCEIAAMLTSWFNFGDVAFNEGGWFLGIAATFSAFLGLLCVLSTITTKSVLLVSSERRNVTELGYAFDGFGCCCCFCCYDWYKQSTFEKHMAMSTLAEFFWFGIHATVNYQSGWAGIFYSLVMMLQIFMTERYLLQVGAKYLELQNRHRVAQGDDTILIDIDMGVLEDEYYSDELY